MLRIAARRIARKFTTHHPEHHKFTFTFDRVRHDIELGRWLTDMRRCWTYSGVLRDTVTGHLLYIDTLYDSTNGKNRRVRFQRLDTDFTLAGTGMVTAAYKDSIWVDAALRELDSEPVCP